MREYFKKEEKLKKRKFIEQLFSEGSTVSSFPIKLIYLEFDHNSPFKIQAGVSVSKRNFKSAVKRNRIKRLLREAYRKNKHLIYETEHTKKHLFMFIYVGKNNPDYSIIEANMNRVIDKFLRN